MKELLIASKEGDKLKVKICNKEKNNWSPNKYRKIIENRDYNLLAYLLYDLYTMGYPIEKAFHKFKEMLNEPELFFLK